MVGYATSILLSSTRNKIQILQSIAQKKFSIYIYSDAMKVSQVILIFKGGKSVKHLNYRPVSVLSHFNEIFEKLQLIYLMFSLKKCIKWPSK